MQSNGPLPQVDMTEIEVPVEDLINTTSPAATHKALPATHIPTTMTPCGSAFRGTNATLSKVDADADSVSLRASMLSRNTTKRSVTPSQREQSLNLGIGLSSSTSSVRSVARSTNTNMVPPEPKRHDTPSGPRPDSKLTPSSASFVSA